MDVLERCFTSHLDEVKNVLFGRIFFSLVASRFFNKDETPEKDAENKVKMDAVLAKVERKIKQESDGSYFWKFVVSLESYYPELAFKFYSWLESHGYYCPEIQRFMESHRITFILLQVGLSGYVDTFQYHHIFYVDDLADLTSRDYQELIPRLGDRKAFLHAVEQRPSFMNTVVNEAHNLQASGKHQKKLKC